SRTTSSSQELSPAQQTPSSQELSHKQTQQQGDAGQQQQGQQQPAEAAEEASTLLSSLQLPEHTQLRAGLLNLTGAQPVPETGSSEKLSAVVTEKHSSGSTSGYCRSYSCLKNAAAGLLKETAAAAQRCPPKLQKALGCLKDFPEDQINSAVKESSARADLSEIKDRSAHLWSRFCESGTRPKGWRPRAARSQRAERGTIKALLERTLFITRSPERPAALRGRHRTGTARAAKHTIRGVPWQAAKGICDEDELSCAALTSSSIRPPDDMNTQRKNPRLSAFCTSTRTLTPPTPRRSWAGAESASLTATSTWTGADPIDDNEEVNLSDVKILYVKNLSSDVTEDQVREAFGSHGPLEKSEAHERLRAWQGLLEVSLADQCPTKSSRSASSSARWSITRIDGAAARPLLAPPRFDGGAAGGFYNSRGRGVAAQRHSRSGGRGGRCGGGGLERRLGRRQTPLGGGGFSGGYLGGARAPPWLVFRRSGAPRYERRCCRRRLSTGASGFGGGGFRGGRGGGGGGLLQSAVQQQQRGAGRRGRALSEDLAGGRRPAVFRGGGGRRFRRGMKRKAQDGGPGGGGGGDSAGERGSSKQQSRAADQDWTSDVTGNW
uniref:RRM domain-containing protein n=1 Tax=Macrostomum lignano TaxID=282301 RepID=A0A1I8F9L2_9PLAT